jgi:SAM-dependent methyltransferase
MPGVSLHRGGIEARDTDADWRELGVTEPYWGVLSHPDFRRDKLTPEGIARFYESGPFHIGPIAAALEQLTGRPPSGRALDFGCGVGRLAEAMTAHAGDVTGVDISPGMLALARAPGNRVTYVDQMPAGPFDWINSFIVFQHIPQARGEAIIKDLLSRLADGGMLSLQIVVWRDANRQPPPEIGWRRLVSRDLLHRARAQRLPVGHIQMYDYDLSKVVRLMNLAGIEEIRLVSTNHDGHHGYIILGQKTAPATH